jgi:hypothetical protein
MYFSLILCQFRVQFSLLVGFLSTHAKNSVLAMSISPKVSSSWFMILHLVRIKDANVLMAQNYFEQNAMRDSAHHET